MLFASVSLHAHGSLVLFFLILKVLFMEIYYFYSHLLFLFLIYLLFLCVSQRQDKKSCKLTAAMKGSVPGCDISCLRSETSLQYFLRSTALGKGSKYPFLL